MFISLELPSEEKRQAFGAMRNLRIVLFMQGKFSEAESMYGEDMKLWEDYDGKEHPSTPVCRYDVAAVLCRQEKDDEAEDMHR